MRRAGPELLDGRLESLCLKRPRPVPLDIGADVTGDGFTDLVARKADGTLWLYANNYVRDNGDAYSAARQIGSSWDIFNKIV